MREPTASRRQFLLGLIAAAAVAGTGFKIGQDEPIGELGRSIEIIHDDWNLARQLLVEDAAKVLPAGTIFDIRLGSPSDYGRKYQMAWYTSPAVRKLKPGTCDPPEWQPEGGFYLFGRFRCP